MCKQIRTIIDTNVIEKNIQYNVIAFVFLFLVEVLIPY